MLKKAYLRFAAVAGSVLAVLLVAGANYRVGP
jgi:hypothetical protein